MNLFFSASIVAATLLGASLIFILKTALDANWRGGQPYCLAGLHLMAGIGLLSSGHPHYSSFFWFLSGLFALGSSLGLYPGKKKGLTAALTFLSAMGAVAVYRQGGNPPAVFASSFFAMSAGLFGVAAALWIKGESGPGEAAAGALGFAAAAGANFLFHAIVQNRLFLWMAPVGASTGAVYFTLALIEAKANRSVKTGWNGETIGSLALYEKLARTLETGITGEALRKTLLFDLGDFLQERLSLRFLGAGIQPSAGSGVEMNFGEGWSVLPVARELVERIAATRSPVRLDGGDGFNFPDGLLGVGGVYALPVHLEGASAGFVLYEAGAEEGAGRERRLPAFYGHLAGLIAAAREWRGRSESARWIDSMTGLFNHAAFEETLRMAANRADTGAGSFTVCAARIDRYAEVLAVRGFRFTMKMLEDMGAMCAAMYGETAAHLGEGAFCVILEGSPPCDSRIAGFGKWLEALLDAGEAAGGRRISCFYSRYPADFLDSALVLRRIWRATREGKGGPEPVRVAEGADNICKEREGA